MNRSLLPSFVLLALCVVLLSGCSAFTRTLREENQALRQRSLQHQQDLQALEGRYRTLQAENETLKAKVVELERDLETARERAATMSRAMTDSQRAQAETLVRDMEERLARENQLRRDLDDSGAEVESLRNERDLLRSELADARTSLADVRKQLDDNTARLTEVTETLNTIRAERDTIRTERDDFRRRVEALHASGQTFSEEASKLSEQVRELEQELAAAQRELEEQRTAAATRTSAASSEESTAAALALRDKLARALDREIREGSVTVSANGSEVRFVMLSDVLFEPVSVILSGNGMIALGLLVDALQTEEFQTIRVEGHTDNTPVRTMPFIDNWELAGSRAAAVTRWLAQRSEIPARKLSASSHAFFSPAASNDTAEGRRQNRRVEIVIQR